MQANLFIWWYLDVVYAEDCNRDSQKFFVILLTIDCSGEVAKLLLLLHRLAPDGVEIEIGFSLTNLIKIN